MNCLQEREKQLHYGQGSICQKAEPGKYAGKKEGEERENPHGSEEEKHDIFERELKNVWNGASFSEPKVCQELLLWKADGSDPCQNPTFRQAWLRIIMTD